MIRDVILGLWVGSRRRWKLGLGAALAALGGLWLVTEVLTRTSTVLSAWLDANGHLYLQIAAGASVLAFLKAVYEVRRVSFCIPTTDTTLTLKFGDLFAENCDWLIGVNEFFDGRLGDVISKKSLHGQYIDNEFNGDEHAFRNVVDAALQGFAFTSESRVAGNQNRYELGTTAVLNRSSHKVYLVAVSKTDPNSHKASSSISILWNAMKSALFVVHQRGNGNDIALPLVGNGRSSINMPPQHLLRLLTLSIVDGARTFQLPRNVAIVLSEDCFTALDLREIKRDWRAI